MFDVAIWQPWLSPAPLSQFEDTREPENALLLPAVLLPLSMLQPGPVCLIAMGKEVSTCQIQIRVSWVGWDCSWQSRGTSPPLRPSAHLQGHIVGLLVVDTFNNVDLALVWPVWAYHPERRPRATNSTGHVCHIEDEEPRLVALVAGDTYAGASAGNHIAAVNTHLDARCR